MAVRVLSAADYVVFALILVLSSAVGIYYAWKDRKAKDNKQYLSADGQLGIFPVTMSLVASYMSSQTILGVPSEMYSHGTALWSSNAWMITAVIVTNFVFLPIFYKANFTSINKYFLRRYNSNTLRMMCSFVSCLSMMFYMGVVLYGPALAITSVTNFSVGSMIVTIGIICTFYTAIGGLKAVIWTDTIQMIIILAGLTTVLIKICVDQGGIGEVWRIAAEGKRISYPDFNIKPFYPVPTFFDAMCFGMVTWTALMSANQTAVQRYCSMGSLKKARMILVLHLPGSILTSSLAALCGLSLYVNYRNCDPKANGQISSSDELMPYYVLESLNYAGLPGLFVASVFSGSLSTLSSGYTSLSAITWGDFLKPILKYSGKKELIFTKITAASYGLISIGIAFLCSNVDSIIQANSMLGGPLGVALFATYLTAITCPFVNRKGAIIGLMCGAIWCLTTGLGSMIIGRPQISLEISVSGCNSSMLEANMTSNISEGGWYSNMTMASTVMEKNYVEVPSGIKKIFYFSPYLMPPIAFCITTTVILLTSLLTGGAMYEPALDPDLVFKPMLTINSLKFPPLLKKILCPKVLEKSEIDQKEKEKSGSSFELRNASTEVLVMEKKEEKNRY